MKVFVYKRKMKKGQKRERVEIVENVGNIVETDKTFYIALYNGVMKDYNKNDFIISVFGW